MSILENLKLNSSFIEHVEIEGIGKIPLKPYSIKDYLDIQKAVEGGDELTVGKLMLFYSVVDENGVRQLKSLEEAELLINNIPLSTYTAIMNKITEINSLDRQKKS